MTSIGIFLRGLLMGAADIVPGVSGGTMAFITGIYDTLIASIRAVDIEFARKVLRFDIKGAWAHVNGNFLLPLLIGIATSILSLARLISWILVNHPVPLWAFFFGLILASALVLMRHVERWGATRIACLLAGTGIALYIGQSAAIDFDIGPLGVFAAGFLAICAMILPGISGGFILVLLGMYGPVIEAVKTLDISFLAVLAAGCIAGLMCFSRILHWLLNHYRQATMSLLTGFLFGSLAVVWPWKHVLSFVERSDGTLKPVQQVPVLPAEFTVHTGEPAQVALCVVLMAVGFALVWVIQTRWSDAPGS